MDIKIQIIIILGVVLVVFALAAPIILRNSLTSIITQDETRHICTEQEKQSDICTMEYAPVCGFKTDGTSKTYGNGCGACADQAEYWEVGECEIEKITLEQATQIARDSECVHYGDLTDESFYNENTNTWWIDLIPEEEKPGCNPACVVSSQTKQAEINWRCTGLVT